MEVIFGSPEIVELAAHTHKNCIGAELSKNLTSAKRPAITMKAIKIFLVCCTVFYSTANSSPAQSMEIGIGYGKEFKENTDVEQYEAYVRVPLPFTREFESGLKVLSDVEIGGAMIREAHSDNDGTARFLAMPRAILILHPNIHCFLGFGPGFMIGDTEFTDQNLGGELLFASKLGIQFLLGQHWSVGYNYFHQSNFGIYDYNASLNMHQLAFSYKF